MVVLPGVVEEGVVVVEPVAGGVAPGTHGFATVADVPFGVELLLVLVPDIVVLALVPVVLPVVVPLVLHGPATVPVVLVPIPVDVVPAWLGVVVLVWLGVVVVLWLGVVVDVPLCDPDDDPVMEGFVVVTAPALPVVPAVPVADGVV